MKLLVRRAKYVGDYIMEKLFGSYHMEEIRRKCKNSMKTIKYSMYKIKNMEYNNSIKITNKQLTRKETNMDYEQVITMLSEFRIKCFDYGFKTALNQKTDAKEISEAFENIVNYIKQNTKEN